MSKPRSKASTDGAEPPAVQEPAPNAEEPPPAVDALPPHEESPPPPVPAPIEPAPAQPGLPSPHQNHSLNWITEAQIKFDTFKAGHDALVAERDGRRNRFDAEQREREIQFAQEQARRTETNAEEVADLENRIWDMQIGMTVTESMMQRYTEITRPPAQEQQQEETADASHQP